MAKCIQIGEAGVLRVMSELILRGHSPFKPAVDDHGVDLMLSSGLRIQVKTATLRTRKSETKHLKDGDVISEVTGYHLSLGWTQSGRIHAPIRRKRAYSEECDYFIIWGVDENRFWIVPSYLMDNRTCLVLGPTPIATRNQVMKLVDQGLGLDAIASKLGISPVTVWNRKHAESKTGGFTRAVRMCEGRWEFLEKPPSELTHEDRMREVEIKQLEQMLAAK